MAFVLSSWIRRAFQCITLCVCVCGSVVKYPGDFSSLLPGYSEGVLMALPRTGTLGRTDLCRVNSGSQLPPPLWMVTKSSCVTEGYLSFKAIVSICKINVQDTQRMYQQVNYCQEGYTCVQMTNDDVYCAVSPSPPPPPPSPPSVSKQMLVTFQKVAKATGKFCSSVIELGKGPVAYTKSTVTYKTSTGASVWVKESDTIIDNVGRCDEAHVDEQDCSIYGYDKQLQVCAYPEPSTFFEFIYASLVLVPVVYSSG